MVENYCTTREAAKLLGISVRTAQQWVEKGLLEGWKTAGGHRRITRTSVERVLREQRNRGTTQRHGYALPILIVEDDAALLKLYRARISRWPFEVTIYTAPNGYEGMVMVGETSPRLLVCDLRLPGVNGFQIVRSLCEMERYKDLAIVVVSGLPGREVEAHGGVPERVELMGKPIDFERLQSLASRLWLRYAGARGA
jgi:excisionase family DNA binding protein